MAKLSWGKPTIFLKKLGTNNDEGYKEEYTPVEDSTTLEVSEGDKIEAKVEGGGIEDAYTKAPTFTLTYQIRANKDRKDSDNKPLFTIKDTNGNVEDEYEVLLQPEDVSCFGLKIAKASVSVTTSYNAKDGIIKTFKFIALTDQDTTEAVEFMIINTPTTPTTETNES